MRKKRSVTLYNMIFPVFLIFSQLSVVFLPFMEPWLGLLWLLLVLGGNLVIDWLVTALAMRFFCSGIQEVRKKSLSVLVRVWLAGYAADILSVLLIILCLALGSGWFSDNIGQYFFSSIYRSPYAVIFALAMVFVGGCLIYRFNINWALEDAGLTEFQRRRIALALAVLTAPWLFLLPAELFY